MSLSRWSLYLQLRLLHSLFWLMHFLGSCPITLSFVKKLRTTTHQPNQITLDFYIPRGYEQRGAKRYPVVVNFHGGRFAVGTVYDDKRWVNKVVRDIEAVIMSMKYRPAPEYPFLTAVDGVDAILYLCRRAEELGIDPKGLPPVSFRPKETYAFLSH